jgi:uncharacterized protein
MNDYIYLLRAVRVEMATQGPTPEEGAILGQHLAYLQKLADEGALVVAGRTLDAPPLGLAIFRAESPEAATAIMNADPAVAKGLMTATVHPYSVAVQGK